MAVLFREREDIPGPNSLGVTRGPLRTIFGKHFFKILVKKFCPSLAVLFYFFPQAIYSTTLVENVFHLDLTLLAYKRVFTLYPDMCKVNLEDYKNDQNNHPFNV